MTNVNITICITFIEGQTSGLTFGFRFYKNKNLLLNLTLHKKGKKWFTGTFQSGKNEPKSQMGSEASESVGGHWRQCGRWGSKVEGCMPDPPHSIGGQVRSFLDRRTVLRGRRRTIRGADVMRSNAETFWHQAKVRRLCPLSAALWPARVSHPKDGQWLCQPRGPDFARLPAPIPLVLHVQSR